MNFHDLVRSIGARFDHLVIQPLARFFHGLNPSDRTVLYVLLGTAVVLGFVIGRRARRAFQNRGEARVSRVLLSEFRPPDYHLMNHVTLRMDDGTTQVDHILISRFGVFVIETKHYKGWIFANATGKTWTQVLYRHRFKFQNPIFQNKRHVRAVQDLLDFLPSEAIKSLVVFTGKGRFRTDVPLGVTTISQLVDCLRDQTEVVMSLNRVPFCVGRLETARLAISAETDVEHVQNLERRYGAIR